MEPLTAEQQTLVEDNMGLVREFASKATLRRITFDDACQAGVLGLIRAIQGFRPEMGCVLSTIAVPHIRMAIARADRREAPIYIPWYVDHPDKWHAQYSTMDANREKAKASRSMGSLSALEYDPTVSRWGQADDKWEILEDVRKAVSRLPKQQREVVARVVLGEEMMTEVAKEAGVTKQAVMQAKQKAFTRLKVSLARHAPWVA